MTMKQGTPEWEDDRRNYMGASDLPTIFGENPYQGEYELALLKRGEAEPEPPSRAMEMGKLIEQVALKLYDDITGRRTRYIRTTHKSKTYPHMRASLDGRVVGERRGVEVKLARWTEIPRRVYIQCQAQMGIVGLDVVDVMRVSMFHQEPLIIPVERDEALISDLLDAGEAWYCRYVLGDELPPVDGSKAASRHLDRLRGESEMAATEVQIQMLGNLRVIRDRLTKDEKSHKRLVNELKATMAGTGVLLAPGARVAWSETKGRTKVDWQALAMVYRSLLAGSFDPEWLDEHEQRHTTTGDPSTRFAVKYEEETT